uniref:Uncharacterized protein n=1 Tax=Alexandrium monilatum TaxID=311494 RepID=A0A7S4QJI7_9DINO|mmetsp:Transcript_6312/g.19028  ORF Transcript_6312/g.19028 Transcript_6312/m.19028 type:complete len:541 (+) Transcript_6312:103-1725(+)
MRGAFFVLEVVLVTVAITRGVLPGGGDACRQGLGVFVVEQHGDVLRHWPTGPAEEPVPISGASGDRGSMSAPQAGPTPGQPPAEPSDEPRPGSQRPASRLALVHIDSHSDLMEIEAPLGRWKPLLRRALEPARGLQAGHIRAQWQREASRLVQIGDFITAALWLGLVDEVVWIRSDFPTGSPAVYNGPQPGKYLVDLDWEPAGTGDSDSPADHHEAERLWEDAGAEFSLCFQIAHVWWEWPLAELRGTNDTSGFDTCKRGRQQRSQPRRFNLTVATMEQMLRILETGAPWGEEAAGTEPKPWVLDVDLDFFASFDPAYESFLARGLTEGLARTLTALLHTNGTCSRRGPGEPAPDQQRIRAGLLRFVRALPRSLAGFDEASCSTGAIQDMLKATDSATSTCELGPEQASELCKVVVSLNPHAQQAWAAVFDPAEVAPILEDFFLSLFQKAPGPHFAAAGEVRRGMALFGRFLNHTGRGALRNTLHFSGTLPLLVTLARSMYFDRYLPEEFWPLVERGAQGALAAAFGQLKLHYERGLRPP